MIRTTLAVLAISLAAPAWAETYTISPGSNAQERLQEALILAEPGDEIVLAPGKYEITDGLSLDVDNVTLRGAGLKRSVLDFTNQQGAGEGLMVTSDNVTLRGFSVVNPKGDGIKSKGADQIIYDKIRVEWTGGPKASNGAYGIYPVESKNVLVQDSYVRGASDAGIYVGQSENIIVRRNMVVQNVAGIEIENSNFAEVTQNVTTKNTGGILVFDLPGLPKVGGGSVLVTKNAVLKNNTGNFAPEGNIVASVPAGTGIMVMANSGVHISDNVLKGNQTAHVMLVAYTQKFADDRYEPRPVDVVIRGNQFEGGGTKPDFPGGEQLVAAVGGSIPPVLTDGLHQDLAVVDRVGVLSLGLTRVGQSIAEANPAPVPRSEVTSSEAITPLKPVRFPAEMEARLQ